MFDYGDAAHLMTSGAFETSMGLGESFPCGPNNPIPIPNRGLRFFVNSYAHIQTSDDNRGPRLAPNHTVSAWVRVGSVDSAYTCIMSQGNSLSLCVDNMRTLLLNFQLDDFTFDKSKDFTIHGKIDLEVWYNLAWEI